MHSFIELAYKLINIVKRFWVCLYIPSDKGMWCFGAVYMHEYACERQINEAVGCIFPVFLLMWKCATAASVQFSLSVVSDSLRPHGLQHARLRYPPPTPGACSLMSIESVMPSNHLILCHPLLLQPSIFPSIRVFHNESVLPISWPKFWSFSFSISPSNEYSGLISFRIDWLDLLAIQGTLKSLLQHHSSKAPVLLI